MIWNTTKSPAVLSRPVSLLGIIAFVTVISLGLAGCPTDGGEQPGPGNTDITYSVTANGNAGTTTSTQLTFTFSADPSGIAATDITVSGAAAKTDAALGGSGTTRTLAITVSGVGNAAVSIAKTGIESRQKTVPVHTPSIDSVTVSAGDGAGSVSKGGTLQFTAVVTGSANLTKTDKGVTWSITTVGKAGGTTISNGLLTVAAGETRPSLTVRAVSTLDNTKYGELTVSVTALSIITVGYDRGTITLKDADGAAVTSISLSKSGALSSITLSADDTFSSVTWYVNGKSVSSYGSSLTLNAASYAAKTHSVTFTGWRNGSYLSSAPIPFTVTN